MGHSHMDAESRRQAADDSDVDVAEAPRRTNEMLGLTSKRVYKYGLLPPVENVGAVDAIMRLGHEYRNRLTQVNRETRQHLRDLILRHPDVATLEESLERLDSEVQAADRAIKATRAATRSRSETAEARATLRTLRANKSEILGRLRDARTTAHADTADERARLFDELRTAKNAARGESGLGRGSDYVGAFGTYQFVEEAAEQAAKMKLFDRGEAVDPHFKRWDSSAAVMVPVHQKGPEKSGIATSRANACKVQMMQSAHKYARARSTQRDKIPRPENGPVVVIQFMKIDEACIKYGPLIKFVAGQYVRPGFDEEDLIQESYFGVAKALEDWDTRQGYESPDGLATLIVSRIRDVLKALTSARARTPSAVLDPVVHARSLDAPLQTPDGILDCTLLDVIPAPEAEDPIESEERIERLQRILKMLPEKDREILVQASEAETQQELAERLGIPRETVRNRHKSALEKAQAIHRRLDRPSLIVPAPARASNYPMARAA